MRPLIAALATLTLACGPLVEANLAMPEWCQTMDRKDVPAAPPGMAINLQFEGAWALPPVPEGSGAESDVDVELVRIELAGDGLRDLGFLTDATIVANPAGAAVTLAELGGAAVEGGQAVLVPPAEQELTQLFAGRELPVATRLSGELPSEPWAVEVRACFRSKARYAWDPLSAEAPQP